ncbi:MAG TPA: glucoamylase family protein [Oligoflexia bacterium]|nr:glucoamylase family protein [Oligoflexia bacterium]
MTCSGCVTGDFSAKSERTPMEEDALLETLQSRAFSYFTEYSHPKTGLIADSNKPQSPASIAAIGMGIASMVVAAERGFITRSLSLQMVTRAIKYLWEAPQGADLNSTGYKGFLYHFLDCSTGKRAWQSEVSTIDTALLIAGALVAAAYFDRDTGEERELRELVDKLYRRIEWDWALNGGLAFTHGWTPENGFMQYRWQGYDEAMILYVLALGSPTFPILPESYLEWTKSFCWKSIYGHDVLYAGPLFIHQYSHLWIDLRDIQDAVMREHQSDYFKNSRLATLIHQEYGLLNPLKFDGCCGCCWGITATDGPGPATVIVDGIERTFFDYCGRGAPFGPDDGTIAPWVAIASLPFAPEIVLPAIEHFTHLGVVTSCQFGFETSFNRTFVDGSGKKGWVSPGNYGLNQGPVVIMVENYRTQLIWNLLRKSPYISTGLKRAGFSGGWLT